MITKVLKYSVFSLALTLGITSCDDLFEPALENQKNLEETQKESSSVRGFLVNAYSLLPEYYDNSDYATDDAVTNNKSDGFVTVATGGWTADNGILSRWNESYAAFQYINLFLKTREGQRYVKNLTVNELLSQRLLGEAYGLYGIHLYYLLRNHAGIASDGQLSGAQIFDGFLDTNSDFNIPRTSFDDCVRLALDYFDKAVALLPSDYNDVASSADIPAKYLSITDDPGNYNLVMGNKSRQLVNGRIVEAFRSRLLLLAASPAFQSPSFSWANAADAAAVVIDDLGGLSSLPADGLTYYEVGTLKDGANPAEIIWRKGLEESSSTQEQNNYPPSLNGNGRMNPTQNLVDAFPMANGYPITDNASGYDANDPYANRDPRLDLYIIHDGSKAGTNNSVIRTGSKSGTDDGIDKLDQRSTRTGYYMKKRLRQSVNYVNGQWSGVDHITPRIRVTEMFLNYAEAANEAWGPDGKGTHNYSAYDVIKAIRQRAGITDNTYLDQCKADKAKMRELIRNERRIELCFESFRFWDLRRWDANLTEAARGLDINETSAGKDITPLNNIEVRDFQPYQKYGPIPQSEVLKYKNLLQNAGW